MALVSDPNCIRLAMLGMVDGNGHPFSWSAIINGDYDAQAMADCGFPLIPAYLDEQPKEALGIDGAKVTHVWCDNPADAARVAHATHIPNVVARPEDVLGEVDAVIIPTDHGWEHVDRARPFIEAGLPVFIDKPLADREDDLRQFVRWHAEGKHFVSTSAMRYAREFARMQEQFDQIGQLRLLTGTMSKSWERYGIHILEAVFPMLTPGGWLTATNTGGEKSSIVCLRHREGVDVVLAVVDDLYGAFGCVNAYGTQGFLGEHFSDTFYSFKRQLETFVDYLRTGQPPFDFAETVEQIRTIIAGIRSREQGGRTVKLEEIDI